MAVWRKLTELTFLIKCCRLSCSGDDEAGRVVFDGSKVKANASKHKVTIYGPMQEQEKRLREKVKRLLEQAEKVDADENAGCEPDSPGDEPPTELAQPKIALTEGSRSQACAKECR